jgi:hypothetical protein
MANHLSELVEAFVALKRAKGLHPEFLREIEHVGELFVEFAGIDPPGDTITASTLKEFETWLAEQMSANTAHKYRGRLAAAIETTLGLPRWSLTKATGRKGRIRPELSRAKKP